MKKILDTVLCVALLVTLLFLAGTAADFYPANAQSPTIGPEDEGAPSSQGIAPILPTQPTPDQPAPDIPPATGAAVSPEGLTPAQSDFQPGLSPAACLQGPGAWEVKTPLSSPMYGAGVASDGVYIYMAGGEFAGVKTTQFARYDPVNDAWMTLAPLPTAVVSSLALYAEGKIFVLGGVNNANVVVDLVQIYTIATNAWSAGAPMPGVRHQMSGGYHMGILFAVGGYDSLGVFPQNQNWAYSIVANSWAYKEVLPAAVGGAASGMVNGHLFVIGGRDATHSSLNSVYDYSIAANSWSSKTPIPVAVNAAGSAVYLNRIWVLGGGDPFTGMTDTQIYNPGNDAWSPGPPLNSGRSFLGGAAVRNRIVSIGGWSITYADTVEVATQPPLNVLIVFSDNDILPATLQSDLSAQPGIGQVDVFNGRAATPTVGQLQAYDIIVPFSNLPWSNSAALGDALADFQDAGGVVVGLNFDWSIGYEITGRWQTSGYSPFDLSTGMSFTNVSLGSIQRPGHPLLAGVQSLTVFYHVTLPVASGATQIASWSDGTPALAFKDRAVGVNAYLSGPSGGWDGDFAAIIANAGYWLRSGRPVCFSQDCQNPNVFEGSISSTDLIQTGRLMRLDPASTCFSPTTCEIFDANPRHYDVYPFVNNTDSVQCVSVTLDPGTCTGANFIQSAAYLGRFDASNTCSNYLADIGGSPLVPKSYSFSIGAWQSYSVVVNEVDVDKYCSYYKLTVTPRSCVAKDVFLPLIDR